jgi:hypothetical protein
LCVVAAGGTWQLPYSAARGTWSAVEPWRWLGLLLCLAASISAEDGAAAAAADATAAAEASTAAEAADTDGVVLTEGITVKTSDSDSSLYTLELRRSQDPAAAAVAFAERHGTTGVDAVLTLANLLVKKVAEASHELPSELRLRTAGAHKKKAEELAKEGEHDQAACHLIRALLRQGLDEAMVEQLRRQFETAMAKLPQQRQAEAAEAAEAAAAEARRVDEALALEEARVRAARDEADWSSFMALHFGAAAAAEGRKDHNAAGAEAAAEATEEVEAAAEAAEAAAAEEAEAPLVVIPISLNNGADAPPLSKQLALYSRHEDGVHAAYEFCAAHGLHAAEQVGARARTLRSRPHPPVSPSPTPSTLARTLTHTLTLITAPAPAPSPSPLHRSSGG